MSNVVGDRLCRRNPNTVSKFYHRYYPFSFHFQPTYAVFMCITLPILPVLLLIITYAIFSIDCCGPKRNVVLTCEIV